MFNYLKTLIASCSKEAIQREAQLNFNKGRDAQLRFHRECPHVRCSCCNAAHYDDDDHNDYCELEKELGLLN